MSAFTLLLFTQNSNAEVKPPVQNKVPSKVQSTQFKVIDTAGAPIEGRTYLIVYANKNLNLSKSFVASGITNNNGLTDIVQTNENIGIIVSDPAYQEFKQVVDKCFYESKKRHRDLQPKFSRTTSKEYLEGNKLVIVVTEKITCEYNGA